MSLICVFVGFLLRDINSYDLFRKSFQLMTSVHTYLFPYLLYPGQMIMMTASIFMTVAIAMERYAAVHYPLNYNQVSFAKSSKILGWYWWLIVFNRVHQFL